MARERLELTKGVNTFQAPNIVAKMWASHLYNAASAALYLGESLICWTNADETDLMFNEHCCQFTTGRIWFDGTMKRRAFYGFKIEDTFFGISPAIQSIDVLHDYDLGKFGLVLETQSFPWQPAGEPPIKTLKFDIEKIIEKPYWTNLCQALDYHYQEDKENQEIDKVVIANILGLRAPEKFPNIYDEKTYTDLMSEFLNNRYYKQTTVYRRRAITPVDI